MPDFDQVEQALLQIDAETDAAESHGCLSGLLIWNESFERWIESIASSSQDGIRDLGLAPALQVLETQYQQTRSELHSEDLQFYVILPDDEEEFAKRLIALSSWCSGFLFGLSSRGDAALRKLSEEAQECLSDLLEISKLSHTASYDEDAELQFFEIVEHVRLCVLYLNEELNPVAASRGLH